MITNFYPSQLSDLVLVGKVDKNIFKNICKNVCSATKIGIRASSLTKLISEVCENKESADAMSRTLLSLSSLRRNEHISIEELITGLFNGLKDTDIPDDALENLKDKETGLKSLLNCDAVRLPAKALQLSLDHQRLYASSNVVTDLRPIFDSARSEMMGGVVFQSLKVQFLEGGEPKEISFVLDLDDLNALKTEIETSITKAKATKAFVADRTELDAFILGDEKYGIS